MMTIDVKIEGKASPVTGMTNFSIGAFNETI